jgi:hypothetical protein
MLTVGHRAHPDGIPKTNPARQRRRPVSGHSSATAPTAASLKQVKIGPPKWTGLRCLVPVEGADEGMTLDLWAPGQSLQAEPKGPVPINPAGPTRLFARDDAAAGELVVLDAGGIVVARKLVEIPQ